MTMFRKTLIVLALVLIAGAVGLALMPEKRQSIVGIVTRAIDKTQLPNATSFSGKAPAVSGSEVAVVESGRSQSEHFAVETGTTVSPVVDPFAENGALPKEINLDVPFISQAPTGNWALPYQEACEESAGLMVAAYFNKEKGVTPQEAERRINAFVDYEKKVLGYYEDTSATTSAKLYEDYFKIHATVVPFDLNRARRAVANGYPVLIPANGKTLPNPYFQRGGPIFHMIVMKGYTGNKIITNDSGTSRGLNFFYDDSALQFSAHDWNNGNVSQGESLMIVVTP